MADPRHGCYIDHAKVAGHHFRNVWHTGKRLDHTGKHVRGDNDEHPAPTAFVQRAPCCALRVRFRGKAQRDMQPFGQWRRDQLISWQAGNVDGVQPAGSLRAEYTHQTTRLFSAGRWILRNHDESARIRGTPHPDQQKGTEEPGGGHAGRHPNRRKKRPMLKFYAAAIHIVDDSNERLNA